MVLVRRQSTSIAIACAEPDLEGTPSVMVVIAEAAQRHQQTIIDNF
jgi:hypothetical protein